MTNELLDEYQMSVHKNFGDNSWLGSASNCRKAIDWITFLRRNISTFIEDVLLIPLHWYQIIWIYVLSTHKSTAIVASRASAKSFIIAVFACAKCILFPNSKFVIASATKNQAGLIVTEKIEKELMPKSPRLAREIVKIVGNTNKTEVIFRNGSTITVVPASENALGMRSTDLIFEEFKIIKEYIVDSVLSPFLVSRHCIFRGLPHYVNNKELIEEPTKMFISSSFRTSTWQFRMIKNFINTKFGDGTNCLLACDYSVSLKHGIKTMATLLDDKRKFDPITWRIEYENEALKENTSAFFTYDMILPNQINKQLFYPRKTIDVLTKKSNQFAIPRQDNEIRIISCDMAFVDKDGNDNSVFSCIRLLPETINYKTHEQQNKEIQNNKGYRRVLSYLEANRGGDIDIQAIRIKQLYEDFDADYCVLDARNGGRQKCSLHWKLWSNKLRKKTGKLKCQSEWKDMCKNIFTCNA